MAHSELVFQSAEELGKLIRSRQVSPVEVVKAHLERIDATNASINAFITVIREEALASAREAEKEIAAGRYRGPLHGIPYAPKDMLATKGIRTTNGSRVTADWVPDYESTITARLNQAGAILIGKLNCLEFAMGSGILSFFGPTHNPWALDHSPSGSSSGSGAAVAAGMTPLAIGSDTGGSIRSPANVCGIVGLKQTYGRVSRFGVTTLSWTCDHAGPMTRTVRDAALMLAAMAGADPNDETCAHHPVPDYTRAMTGDVKGLKIGVPVNHFFEQAKPESKAAVHAALAKLEEMGARVVDVEVPHAEVSGRAISVIEMSEASCYHEKRLREHADLMEPVVRERLEIAKLFSATDYIKAMRVRTIVTEELRRVFEKCDVMAVPGGNPAIKAESPEDVRSDVTRAPRKEPWTIGNMTGYPAIVVPCGFAAGPPVLPVGIQFYAKPFEEGMLFRVAQAYESATEWHKRRPPEPV
jgi:aspartyl-tRNA(Asn)/glutamyl-tRNA(Gln) amidotransferase subunit A